MCCLSFSLWAQNVRQQTLDVHGSKLRLEAPFAAQIRITPIGHLNKIQFTYQVEGEYQNQTSLAVKSTTAETILSEIRLPTFVHPQDKLSAHKAIASIIEISLPSSITLEIQASNAHLYLLGPLGKTRIALDSGRCELSRWDSETFIQTRDADVLISGKGLLVSGSSREGQLQIDPEPAPKNKVVVQSIKGNISYLREQ